jgi:hypothetical protein
LVCFWGERADLVGFGRSEPVFFKRVEPFPGDVCSVDVLARMRVITSGSRTRVEFDLKTPRKHSHMWTGVLLGVFLGLIVGFGVGSMRSQREGIVLGLLAGIPAAGFLPVLIQSSQVRMARPIIEVDAEAKTLLLWQMERPRDLTQLDRLVLRIRRGEWAAEQSLGVSVHGIARGGERELWVYSMPCSRGQTRELVDHLHQLCSPILPVVVESLVENLRHPLQVNKTQTDEVDGG